MPARTAGRKGRPWRRAVDEARAQSTGVCALCGHPVNRGEINHRTNLVDGGHPTAQYNLEVVHGSSDRCPVCGKACNQAAYWAAWRARRADPAPPPKYARW